MEAVLAHSPINETQRMLLRTFSRINSEEERDDIQSLLLDYYRKRVDVHANSVSFSNEEIDEILNSHARTPYK